MLKWKMWLLPFATIIVKVLPYTLMPSSKNILIHLFFYSAACDISSASKTTGGDIGRL